MPVSALWLAFLATVQSLLQCINFQITRIVWGTQMTVYLVAPPSFLH